jgi:phosphoglycerate dehydrogenase-like enzyme
MEIARRVASLGARVMALRRRAPTPADRELTAVFGDGSLAARIEIVSGPDGLEALLRRSDVVVVSAPETPDTRGMIGGRELGWLKRGALVINVSRGRLIDERALIETLAEGRVRGAGLDVFGEEPLPSDNPLWRLPNVLITPHVSGVTRGFWRRETDLILRNLRRHLDGAPPEEWENVVDKRAGY